MLFCTHHRRAEMIFEYAPAPIGPQHLESIQIDLGRDPTGPTPSRTAATVRQRASVVVVVDRIGVVVDEVVPAAVPRPQLLVPVVDSGVDDRHADRATRGSGSPRCN